MPARKRPYLVSAAFRPDVTIDREAYPFNIPKRSKGATMNDAQGRLTYIAPVFRVRDLKRSLAFYRDQLGFGLDFCYEDFYASVSRDGCHLHLQCAGPPHRDQAAFEQAELIDACVVVPDAEALSSIFASAGVPFTVTLRHMPYGVEFYIRDPDGYALGFVQPAPE